MARMTRTHGSCPICGVAAQRFVSLNAGVVSEATHCPEHGRRSLSPHGMTVAEWAMPSMPNLAEMLGLPALAY